MRWERGDITFLYRGDAASPEESLYVLDNQLRVYQKVNIFLNVITYSDHFLIRNQFVEPKLITILYSIYVRSDMKSQR